MATPFPSAHMPRGMPIREAGPRPIEPVYPSTPGLIGEAIGQVGEAAGSVSQEITDREERQRRIDDMIEKRRLARQAQIAREEFLQKDFEFKQQKAQAEQEQLAREQRIEDAEIERDKIQREKVQTDWTAFKDDLKELIKPEPGQKAEMPDVNELARIAAINNVFETEEGRKRFSDLASKIKSGPTEFQREKFGHTQSQDLFGRTKKLRDEFVKQNKDFQKVEDAFNRVKAATKDPSPAGDLALIFNYMKMLDPGSVVRESEFATAAASGSYGERFKAAADRILSGRRLSSAQRKDFLSRAKGLGEAARTGYKQSEKTYRNLATSEGLDPSKVVIPLGRRSDATLNERSSVNVTKEDPLGVLPQKSIAPMKFPDDPEKQKRFEAYWESKQR